MFATAPTRAPPRLLRPERKLRLRQAAAEAAKEVEEYRAMRAHKLLQGTSEVRSRACGCGCVRVCRRTRAAHRRSHRPRLPTRPPPPPSSFQSAALVDKVRRVTAETDARLASLDAEYARNRDVVIGVLLQVVLSIENPFAAAANKR